MANIIHAKKTPFGTVACALAAAAGFAKKNTVLTVALFAAVVTAFVVPPDAKYLSYFDFKTLTCLFCTLAVVGALRNIRFFTVLAEKIVALAGNLRTATLALVCITFVGSMLIANDMALLTFLPLGYIILETTNHREKMAFVFIMQNIAANLGGMLTPFGNPQNLYLYNKFAIPTGEFMLVMAPPFALSIAMIAVCCFVFVKPVPLAIAGKNPPLPRARTAFYVVLFALSIAIVFHAVPYQAGLVIIVASLLFCDRKALAGVDYPLLCTFAAFFVFAGNMSRIEAVRNFVEGLLTSPLLKSAVKVPELFVSALSCQFISNVPSAILLSQFTENWRPLLVGVNIGGTGTLIASLASLITFREYSRRMPEKKRAYVALFSAFNLVFLAILLVFETFMLA